MIIDKRKRVAPMMSLYYKYQYVAVRQDGFLSSSPRWLSIRFFSKALAGERRALTFLYGMAIILTPPCSPDFSFTLTASTPAPIFLIIQIFSNMRSYMSLTVLALAASTFSSALSAPIR